MLGVLGILGILGVLGILGILSTQRVLEILRVPETLAFTTRWNSGTLELWNFQVLSAYLSQANTHMYPKLNLLCKCVRYEHLKLPNHTGTKVRIL